LSPGETLQQSEALESTNEKFIIAMQTDCNLVAYKDGVKTWSSSTKGKGENCYLENKEGNIILYDEDEVKLWETKTSDLSGVKLIAQDAGIIEGVDSKSNIIWNNNVGNMTIPDNTMLIIGGIGGAVLLLILIIVLSKK
jgi:hypothetical protein